LLGCLSAIGCSIFTAGALLSIRKVGGRTHMLMLGTSWSIWNSLLSPLLIYQNSTDVERSIHFKGYTFQEVVLIGSICISNMLFQIFLTLAYFNEKAARLAPIASFQIIVYFIVDYLFLEVNEPVLWNKIIGGLLIFLYNVLISILKC
jgi:drug/metabolite transporter (DMT)-like permease